MVHEDYQRVMKEYRTIEDQEDAKRAKYKENYVRPVADRLLREMQKNPADIFKLGDEELPESVLYNIDKLIRKKLK